MVASSAYGVAELMSRLFDSASENLDPQEAQGWLRLNFTSADRDRVDDLVRRNNEDPLSQAEREELDRYLAVNDLLVFIHSKSRQALKRSGEDVGVK